MGNRPVPTRLKLLRGNPGRRPINAAEPQPARGVPAMPAWLAAFPIAVAEWTREAAQLDAMGMLTLADAGALAMRAYVASQLQALAADVAAEGRVVTLTQLNAKGEAVTTTTRTNPKCVQLAKLLAEYRAYGVLLGLDPSSRTRIKVPVPAAGSLEQLVGRKHGR